ncbi:response regulator [Tamlana crocina]|uniref:Response regulator transcription factor n=1 Tax=Tamlana crocina TaxID=393006 RepID=A0ABX1D9X1_9FLAO|nr:response regulator [Tamlana crocina]NJX13942.1 response regulator transcription factor [Tamlana crocina]
MFKRALVVDDHDVVNEGVLKVLQSNNIHDVVKAQYCDEAYLKIKKATLDNAPFDLLISDLSFKEDYKESKIKSGEELVEALKPDYPNLPIIIYSMEERLQKVRSLVNTYGISAYVCKGRKGAAELSEAILHISKNQTYLSPQVENALNSNNNLEIDDYDIELIKNLSLGLSQSEISSLLKSQNVSPSSLSSIEKRINKLKDIFKANNAIHLVAITKDLGLI